MQIIDLKTRSSREVYTPQGQLGWPAGTPSEKHLAIVEALCGDRWIVAGDLLLIETTSGKIERVDTQDVDITYTEWRSDGQLLLAGHREFETVVGIYDAVASKFTEVWGSREITTGGRYITVSGLNEAGECVLLGESFAHPPAIAVILQGEYQPVEFLRFRLQRSCEEYHVGAPGELERTGRLGDPGLVAAAQRQSPSSAHHACTRGTRLAFPSRLVGPR